MSNCKFCGDTIVWMPEGRKKIPLNQDGMPHECENFKKARKSFKEMDRDELNADLIKQYERGINQKK
ncbi:hypothetical protein N9O57_01820 [bacterium]|nr:hypothetical protein [bacterium]